MNRHDAPENTSIHAFQRSPRRNPPGAPTTLPGRPGVVLGHDQHAESPKPIGFGPHRQREAKTGLVVDDAGGHTVIAGGTGVGKSVKLIADILHSRGSAVVVDLKGEATCVAGRGLLEMGIEPVVLDPFGVTDGHRDPRIPRGSLDPMVLRRLGPTEDLPMMMATALGTGPLAGVDPFWDNNSTALTSGLIGDVLSRPDGSFPQVLDMLWQNDIDMHLAQRLDTRAVSDPRVREAYIGYLEHAEGTTRPSVKSTARGQLDRLRGDGFRQAMGSTSFDLEGWLRGTTKAVIFLVVPPVHMQAAAPAVRLWLATLFYALTCPARIERESDEQIAFYLDELPALGRTEFVPTLYSYLRGYGVRAVSVIQSLAQLENAYGPQSRVILDNAGNRIAFRANDREQAEALARFVCAEPDELLDLAPGEAIMRSGGLTQKVRTNSYLDPEHITPDLVDPNPNHRSGPARHQGGR